MKKFALRRSPVAAACAALFVAAPALAQVAAPAASAAPAATALEDISIESTGFARSLQDSVNLKKGSDQIIEAISAEDLGKLPDVSIADALARLPGLSAQRVNGRAQVINIRGLSPDFGGTLLNGREMVTTGDNRGVEFDQFPAELLNQVLVYKTPEAGLLGQGLSGTVDMRTVRPLDKSGREAAFNIRGESNRLGTVTPEDSNHGKRVSASYVDQFMDHKLGVALGLAYLDTPVLTQKDQIWGYEQNPGPTYPSWCNGCSYGKSLPVGVWLPSGDQAEAIGSTNKRLGAMAVIEFRPSENIHSTLDLYFSKFDQEEHMRGLFWYQGQWAGSTPDNWTNPTYTNLPGGNVLVSGATVTDLNYNGANGSGANGVVVRNDYNQRNDKIQAIGWNTSVKMGGWKTAADLSYSKADTIQSLFETYAGLSQAPSPSPAGLTYHMSADPNQLGNATWTPVQNYGSPLVALLGDPAGWGHDGRQQIIDQKDEITAVRLDAQHSLFSTVVKDVDFGVDYSQRKKSRDFGVSFAYLNGHANGQTSQIVGPGLVLQPTSLAFAGIPNLLSYNVQGVAATYYKFDTVLSQGDLEQDYSVTEKITTGYAKFRLDTEVGTLPVHGNFGLDIVHTDQSSKAFNTKDSGHQTAFGNSIGEITGTIDPGANYNDFLPSLNLVADLPYEMYLKFGAAKTLARPRMDYEKAATSAGISQSNPHVWSGSGGNPQLRPWRARSVDLSLEKYFGKRSYVAVASFYKYLDSWVSQKDVPNYNFSGFTDSSSQFAAVSTIGDYTTWVNRQGGELHGFEFSTSLEGSMLSRGLDGLGLIFSQTLTISSVKDDPTQPTLTIPGLSRDVRNVTFYYDKDGVSARISQRYRSSFRGEVSSLFGQRSYDQILDDRQYDAQVGYEFLAGDFKGLSLLLEVVNLTNSPYRTTQVVGNNLVLPKEYDIFGRSILLGINYRIPF